MGIGASYKRLAHHEPVGAWVWLLDDDDECIHDGLVADVRRIATEQPEAQVIMVRMDHGPELGVLPDAERWGRVPAQGRIGCSAYIVRRDVWQAHAHVFGGGHYASDFDFISAVFASGAKVVWHDVVASRTQRGRMLGAPEVEYAVSMPEEYR